MTVRTRFAPSPTGYLHIGGVRTALFCWLFARRHGGQFILRIDDTDQQRNVEESLAPILHGLHWLGIDWDEGPEVGGPHAPYYQSQRLDRYRAAVEKLLAAGHAYRDYATTEEIQAERQAAEKEKRIFTYSRRFMAETPADCARFEAEGRKGVVRLKMPREGKLVLDDLVRGRVEFDWANEQDHVVQRADGSFIYHLANVVDDEDFEISHVIRAEEHLSNTPRQVFMIEALGYRRPQYAHLPFVAEPGSKNKLSKRKLDKYLKNKDFAQLVEHGNKILQAIGEEKPPELLNPVMVDFYESVGYLPEAIVNYLALLGWSLDDKTEQFTRAELIEKFSLDRVNKAPAGFDAKKLDAFQLRYMQALPVEEKVQCVLPYLQKAGQLSIRDIKPRPVVAPPTATTGRGFMIHDYVGEADLQKVAAVVRAAGDRIKVAGDILDFPEFFVTDEKLAYDPAAMKKAFDPPEAAVLLKQWLEILPSIEPFDAPTLEKRLHDFVAAEGIKIGQIIHPLRVALTGKSVGLGLFDTLAILGRDSSICRINGAFSCHFSRLQ